MILGLRGRRDGVCVEIDSLGLEACKFCFPISIALSRRNSWSYDQSGLAEEGFVDPTEFSVPGLDKSFEPKDGASVRGLGLLSSVASPQILYLRAPFCPDFAVRIVGGLAMPRPERAVEGRKKHYRAPRWSGEESLRGWC